MEFDEYQYTLINNAAVEALEHEEDEVEIEEKPRNKIFIAIAVIVALLITGLVIFLNYRNSSSEGEDTPATVINGNSDGVDTNGEDVVNSGIGHIDLKSPIQLEIWQSASHRDITMQDAMNASWEHGILADRSILSSFLLPEAAGFTMDTEKEFLMVNEFGGQIPNMDFTHVTREPFNEFLLPILERLINPIFGDWTVLHENIDEDDVIFEILLDHYFGDIFTEDLLEKFNNDHTTIPLFSSLAEHGPVLEDDRNEEYFWMGGMVNANGSYIVDEDGVHVTSIFCVRFITYNHSDELIYEDRQLEIVILLQDNVFTITNITLTLEEIVETD